MLNTYYKFILYASGDLNYQILRPFNNASANDVALLQSWLGAGDPGTPTRGVLAMGDGFVEAADAQGGAQQSFVSNYLGATLVDYYYLTFAPNWERSIALPLEPVMSSGDLRVSLENSCSTGLDVLDNNLAIPLTSAATYYASTASGHVSAVHKAHSASHPWIGLTTGYSLQHLRTQFGVSGTGRLVWFYQALSNVFGAICSLTGPPHAVLDVPQLGDGGQFVNFAALRNNPVREGYATVAFGLARDDRVEIALFDVSGRRVRTLAARMFKAGEHEILWDGRDDAGHAAPRGVYFTRVRYADSAFEKAAKLTILR
jgi:hypothetical protein